jgi:biopolymer transport protein ExbB
LKYQEVKSLDSEAAAETIHKEIEEVTSLEMPMLKHDCTFYNGIFRYSCRIIRTVTG